MLSLLQSILNKYSAGELLQMCKTINRDYNIYDPEDVRWAKLEYVLNKTTPCEIELLRKSCLSNKVVNDMIFNYYFCERVIKYHFINHLRGKMDHIVAFEMSIGDSRIDICSSGFISSFSASYKDLGMASVVLAGVITGGNI